MNQEDNFSRRDDSAARSKNQHFISYMGDEEAWSGLVEDLWLMLSDTKNPSLGKLPIGSTQQTWIAILHLLFLGLGWKNPGLGLERWRKFNYEQGLHPVLDVILHVVSDSAGHDQMALEIFLKNCSLRMDGDNGPNASFETATEDEDFETWALTLQESGRLSKLGLEVLPLGGWDPLHLSSHLQDSFRMGDSSCDIRFQNERHATLVTQKYAGWHHHLSSIGKELGLRTDQLCEITVGVKVVGMNKLGDFWYSDETRSWSLVGYGSQRTGVHTWGHDLPNSQDTRDASSADRLDQDKNNLSNSSSGTYENPTEKFSILVREEVGLAHTLEAEVTQDNGEVKHFFYKDKGWDSDPEWENNRHHNECLLALIRQNFIEPDLIFAEAVMEGSLVLEIKPWAHDLAIELWTLTSKFPHFIAEIMTYQKDGIVSIHELEPHLAEQSLQLREHFSKKTRRAKEQIYTVGIDGFFGSGTGIEAREFLEGLVIAYEYFGDD